MSRACSDQPRPRRVPAPDRELGAAGERRLGGLPPGAGLPRARAAGRLGHAPAGAADPIDGRAAAPSQFEGPLWKLVTEQPMHLLAQPYGSWRRVPARPGRCHARRTRAALCATGALHLGRAQRRAHPPPAVARVAVRSPRSSTCRSCSCRAITHAASAGRRLRRVASALPSPPATKRRATLQMPGGQSGHPLSPYYRAGFRDWARGEAAAVPARPRRTHTHAAPN